MKRMDDFQLPLPVLAGLAVASVAWAAGPVVWRALGYSTEAAPSPVRPLPAEGPAPASQADIAPILDFAPFGRSESATRAAAGSSIASLVLEGVILVVSAERSRALIKAAGLDVRSYSPGDTLPGGGVLREVMRDHVKIETESGVQSLAFTAPGNVGATANAVSLGFTQVGSAGLAVVGAPAGASIASTQASAEETIDLYRQKLRDSPEGLAKELDVAPMGTGYRIGAGAPERLLGAGFLPGDVVLRVNGVEVGDLERDRLRFEEVAAASRIRVEVRRGDRVLSLSFPIR